MPFDNTPTPTPTLADLGRLLRHPEEWPPGFEWDYSTRTTCAIGLATSMWGANMPKIPRRISHDFWLLLSSARPHHVADAIDRYLATPGIV